MAAPSIEQAWMHGWRSRDDGAPETACPHSESTREGVAWLAGWASHHGRGRPPAWVEDAYRQLDLDRATLVRLRREIVRRRTGVQIAWGKRSRILRLERAIEDQSQRILALEAENAALRAALSAEDGGRVAARIARRTV